MPRYIMELDGGLLEWSTVVDAPVTQRMTEPEFRDYYQHRYGAEGVRDLEERLARVRAQGTSAHHAITALDLIKGNRAGPHEREATLAELLEITAPEAA